MHPHSLPLVRLQSPQIPFLCIHRVFPASSARQRRQPIATTTFAAATLHIVAMARVAAAARTPFALPSATTVRVVALAAGRTGIRDVGRIEHLHLRTRFGRL